MRTSGPETGMQRFQDLRWMVGQHLNLDGGYIDLMVYMLSINPERLMKVADIVLYLECIMLLNFKSR